jgi:antitoxin ParD1/3/4
MMETLVGAGRYQNASEVPQEGLRMIEARESRRSARIEALRDAARAGFGAIDRGEYRDFDSFDDLERHMVEITESVLMNGDATA